jgi:thiol-disulfide isomerase/thioredoxin
MHAAKGIIALGILAFHCAALGQTHEKTVEMAPVKYDGLKQAILKERGNVVLVDFWAGFCSPCRKAFPQFIELHKKYAAQGLVIITVSVDAPDKKENVGLANSFLRQVNSPFRNLLLDEQPDQWMKKLDFISLPCYYLFDRQGKWVRFGGVESVQGVNYAELEKTVVEMLAEKEPARGRE